VQLTPSAPSTTNSTDSSANLHGKTDDLTARAPEEGEDERAANQAKIEQPPVQTDSPENQARLPTATT